MFWLGAPDSSELSSLIYLFNMARIKIKLFNFTVFSNHLAIFNFVRFYDFFSTQFPTRPGSNKRKKITKLLLNRKYDGKRYLSTLGVLTFN